MIACGQLRKQRTRGIFLERSLLAFGLGNADYTRAMALVKVTFLLNNYGDKSLNNDRTSFLWSW